MANYMRPVKLLPNFDLQSQNVVTDWTFWRTSFADCLLTIGYHEMAAKVKLSTLRNIRFVATKNLKLTSNCVQPVFNAHVSKIIISLINRQQSEIPISKFVYTFTTTKHNTTNKCLLYITDAEICRPDSGNA